MLTCLLTCFQARGALAAGERRHMVEMRRLRAGHAAAGGTGAEQLREEVSEALAAAHAELGEIRPSSHATDLP